MVLNDLEQQDFEDAIKRLKNKGKLDIAKEIVNEISEIRHNPTTVNGLEVNGDVFYSLINTFIEQRLPKANTIGQKQTEFAVFSYVCSKLKKMDYYVHS